MSIEASQLAGEGVEILLADDYAPTNSQFDACASQTKDCYAWDPTTGRSVCRRVADDMVMGTFPEQDYCFSAKYSYNDPSQPLTQFKLGSFDPATNEMSFIDLNPATAAEGLSVCGFSDTKF